MVFGRKSGYVGSREYRPKFLGVELESKRWLRPEVDRVRELESRTWQVVLGCAMVALPNGLDYPLVVKHRFGSASSGFDSTISMSK